MRQSWGGKGDLIERQPLVALARYGTDTPKSLPDQH
jgi:hypothetical protein